MTLNDKGRLILSTSSYTKTTSSGVINCSETKIVVIKLVLSMIFYAIFSVAHFSSVDLFFVWYFDFSSKTGKAGNDEEGIEPS